MTKESLFLTLGGLEGNYRFLRGKGSFLGSGRFEQPRDLVVKWIVRLKSLSMRSLSGRTAVG